MGNLHLATVICGSVSLLLLLVALSSNHWLDLNITNYGLWTACFYNQVNVTKCYFIMRVPEYMVATRAFLILAVIAGFIACGLLYSPFYNSEIRPFSVARSAAIASFLAGLLALVAMAIYTGSKQKISFYGWSFFVGWVGVPFFLVTGGLAHKLRPTPGAILKNV